MSGFAGFRRANGSVGVRNHVLVMSVTGLTGPSARRIGRAVPGVRVLTTPFGSGLMGDDAELQELANPVGERSELIVVDVELTEVAHAADFVGQRRESAVGAVVAIRHSAQFSGKLVKSLFLNDFAKLPPRQAS